MPTSETFLTRTDPVLVTLPDGCRLAARVFGPQGAPPVLLVAGGDGTMLQWRSLVPELCVDAAERELFAAAGCGDSLARDLRVAAFDARGTGWSSRAHGVCATTKEAAADVLALAAALFGGRVHLVGHALGAAVALEVALAGPRLVASLTLISASAGGELMAGSGAGFVATRGALLDALAGDDRDGLAALVRRDVELGFTPGFAAAHPALIDHLAAEALHGLSWERELLRRGAAGSGAAGSHAGQWAGCDLAGRLGEVAVPTLVVRGAHDAVVAPGESEALARRIPGARLVTLEAGHAVAVERATDVAAAVRAHVVLHP